MQLMLTWSYAEPREHPTTRSCGLSSTGHDAETAACRIDHSVGLLARLEQPIQALVNVVRKRRQSGFGIARQEQIRSRIPPDSHDRLNASRAKKPRSRSPADSGFSHAEEGPDHSVGSAIGTLVESDFPKVPSISGHFQDMFELDEEERATRTVRQLMRPIRFVPETKPVNDLMREMQAEGAHMVIVVDEYGNTAGLVTMEDLVEVIRDEHEPGTDVTEDGKGGYVVSGNFDLARVADLFGVGPEE